MITIDPIPIKQRFFFIQLITIISGMCAILQAETIRIEGYLEENLTPDEPNSENLWRSYFSADFDIERGLWYIEDKDSPGERASNGKGSIIQTRTQFDGSHALVHVSLDHDEYPIDLRSDWRFVWFVYMAGDYLRRNEGAHVIFPRGDPRYEMEILVSTFSARWIDEEYLSPEVGEFHFDSSFLESAPLYLTLEGLNNRAVLARGEFYQQLRLLFSDGDVMARYTVLDWLEHDGYFFPQEWLFEEFVGEDLIRTTSGITNMISSTSVVRALDVPMTTSVRDDRFRSVERNLNGITYTIDDGVIPESDNESLLAIARPVSRERVTIAFEETREGNVKFLIIALMILGILAPLVIFLIKKGI